MDLYSRITTVRISILQLNAARRDKFYPREREREGEEGREKQVDRTKSDILRPGYSTEIRRYKRIGFLSVTPVQDWHGSPDTTICH